MCDVPTSYLGKYVTLQKTEIKLNTAAVAENLDSGRMLK
jgi:hypothetical protein